MASVDLSPQEEAHVALVLECYRNELATAEARRVDRLRPLLVAKDIPIGAVINVAQRGPNGEPARLTYPEA